MPHAGLVCNGERERGSGWTNRDRIRLLILKFIAWSQWKLGINYNRMKQWDFMKIK